MNLKEWRKTKGWRQEDLADKLGEPRPTYQAWESGRVTFPPAIKAKIEKMGFKGEWPDPGAELTRADLESLRDEVRTQSAWLREELRKDNTGAAAVLQEILKRLSALEGNFAG